MCYLMLSCSAQKEWGHSAEPQALLDVHPHLYQELATAVNPTMLNTQRRSYTIQVWSYVTFIVIETVIGRYLAVKTW
jgi:hypothetical protein